MIISLGTSAVPWRIGHIVHIAEKRDWELLMTPEWSEALCQINRAVLRNCIVNVFV